MDKTSIRMRCAELAAKSSDPSEKWVTLAAALYEFVSGEKVDADAKKLELVRQAIG